MCVEINHIEEGISRIPVLSQVSITADSGSRQPFVVDEDNLLGAGIIAAFLVGFFGSRQKDSEVSNPVVWKDIVVLGGLSQVMTTLIWIGNWL